MEEGGIRERVEGGRERDGAGGMSELKAGLSSARVGEIRNG